MSSIKLAKVPQATLILYIGIVGIACLTVLYSAFNLSHASSPNFSKFSHKLSPGFFGGRLMDISDGQWRSFRRLIPLASLAFFIFSLIDRFINTKNPNQSFIIALICLLLLHGFHSFKLFLLLAGSYIMGKIFDRKKYFPFIIWSYAIGSLFAVEYIKISSLLPLLTRLCQQYPGIYPRWNIIYNFSILRMISFNIDNHYHLTGKEDYIAIPEHSCSKCTKYGCEIERTQTPSPKEWKTLKGFISFALYPPLYIAGPIITFNDFVHQRKNPIPQKSKDIIIYGIKWISFFIMMEVMSHLFWVVAIKDTHSWSSFTPLQFAGLSYVNLNFVWLKLLLIWRFFRFFSLLDGIVPPENMTRCMSNNSFLRDFWKSWHCSFNHWIIRYMYIPLGGRRRTSYSIWPIFTFVAIWHDLKMRLLAWSWLVCLFMVPEIIASALTKKYKCNEREDFRNWKAFGGSLSIVLMVTANLVGFVVGLDGVNVIFESFLTRKGLTFLPLMMITFYCTSHLVMELEERAKVIK